MGEWEQAIQFYETAKDYYSMVRILCFNGQLQRAMDLAEESGCKAACYHLARRLSTHTEDHVSYSCVNNSLLTSINEQCVELCLPFYVAIILWFEIRLV